MLELQLEQAITPPLLVVLRTDVAKDPTRIPLEGLPSRLETILAV